MELSERFWGSFYVMVCLTGLTFCIKTKSDTAKANTGKSDKVTLLIFLKTSS